MNCVHLRVFLIYHTEGTDIIAIRFINSQCSGHHCAQVNGYKCVLETTPYQR